LDSLTADLRWKPPTIMLSVLQDSLPLANPSMLHPRSCRQGKNVAALHVTPDPLSDAFSHFAACLICVEIYAFVLRRPPQPFDHHVVAWFGRRATEDH